jgi:predicted outer membrane protein
MKRHIALGGALLVALISMGPTTQAQNAENTKRLDSQESAFLRSAAQDDIFEERLGQYAADHAATDEAKQLGRQMAADHEADLKVIEQLAQDHGVDLTKHDSDLTPGQKAVYDQMTSKAGKDFDKDYTKKVLAEHNRLISLYMRERDHAADVAVREYAAKAVSTLESHKKMAADAEKVAWAS